MLISATATNLQPRQGMVTFFGSMRIVNDTCLARHFHCGTGGQVLLIGYGVEADEDLAASLLPLLALQQVVDGVARLLAHSQLSS